MSLPLDIGRPLTTEDIEQHVRQVIARCPKQVDGFQAGSMGMLGYLVGEVMKSTHGVADPRVVTETFQRLLPAHV
jgi:aspartyl-tRNA(Asn)/glutamyl-tRNA(Gln) amidotransferase subunit B